MYVGVYDEELIKNLANKFVENGGEGIVVRLVSSFEYENFSQSVAKYVRENHVQTNEHWTKTQIVKNELKKIKRENNTSLLLYFLVK